VSDTRFEVLGPLRVIRSGEALSIGADQERTLLAVLLLKADQVVGVDELAQWLWPGEAPRNPKATLQNYVWRLRKRIGAGLLRQPLGYRIDSGDRDLDEFRQLTGDAARFAAGGDRTAEAEALRRALALWRGPVLSDVPCDALHRDLTVGIEEELLAALDRRLDADLATGRHAALVGELRTLVARHPLRESFWVHLMLALFRDGRQADALAAYREVSRLLADELGIDPGERLRAMHEAVLAADPALGGPPAPPATPPAAWQTHRQLPLGVAGFVGREALVDEAAALLTAGATMPVLALSGLPGVGKSALAVQIGYRVAASFPDGQWYVPLGGGSEPRDPADVLADLLRGSGVAGDRVPDSVEGRAALLRARLADRRVLLVLDDAAGVDQVVPLLPGASGNGVLITSRQELAGLAVRVGGRYVRLDVLADAEAADLLDRQLGPAGGAADTAERAELVELCGRLPLALRIACANVALDPDATLTRYVGALRDAAGRLAVLAVPGDDRIGVRATFDLSYVALRGPDRRVFGLLGVLPAGTDIDADGVAALVGRTGSPDSRADAAALRRLADANLLTEHRPGRFHLHDLLRLYAADRVAADDTAAARDRLARWYVSTARAACRLAIPGTTEEPAGNPFADRDAAWAWLETERANAVALGRTHPTAADLADALWRYCYYGGYGRELGALATAGLGTGDPATTARMWRYLETASVLVGDRPAAIDAGERAAALNRQLGDAAEEARSLVGLGDDYVDGGRLDEAVEVLTRAVALSRQAGIRPLEANAVNNLGTAYERLGRLHDALAAYREALRGAEELDRPDGVLTSLLNIGQLHWQLGDLATARDHLERSLAIDTPYRTPRTHATLFLARVHTTAGRAEAGLATARQGRDLAEQLGSPELVAWALVELGAANLRLGRLGAAVDHFTEALHRAAGGVSAEHEAEARIGLAATYLAVGRPDAALGHAETAAELADRAALKVDHALASTARGWALHAVGRDAEAAGVGRAALAAHERYGFRIGIALTLHLLGAVDDPAYRERARELYAEIGMPAANPMPDLRREQAESGC
jgi:DNA-binding SARP family transcriptional activator/tetratricopeptide (TPR) repeat protein